ncbi:hypothetical protein [Stenoxybacter acetivorans]|uniref:hypothetical protein n=1 Tax=Stenoxybacter acetivorans TaxID=422441 RepID=UPI00056C81D4|nr:hypothetical protein [Stenoxybacter acetivorans]
MAGLLFLFILLLIFLLIVLFSYIFGKIAAKLGKQGLGKWVFLGIMVFLFWDWIPMEITYKKLCENEAGLTVYKTTEQWQKENLGVWETLRKDGYEQKVKIKNGYITKEKLNQRFLQERYWVRENFSIIRIEKNLFDIKTNEKVQQDINFYTDIPTISFVGSAEKSLPRSLMFWMVKTSCFPPKPLGWSDDVEQKYYFDKIKNYYPSERK